MSTEEKALFDDLDPSKLSRIKQIQGGNIPYSFTVGKRTMAMSRNILKVVTNISFMLLYFGFDFVLNLASENGFIDNAVIGIIDSFSYYIIIVLIYILNKVNTLINKYQLQQVEISIKMSDRIIYEPITSVFTDIFIAEGFEQVPYSDSSLKEVKRRFSEARDTIFFLISHELKDNYIMLYASRTKMEQLFNRIPVLIQQLSIPVDIGNNEDIPQSYLWEYDRQKLTISNTEEKRNYSKYILPFVIILALGYPIMLQFLLDDVFDGNSFIIGIFILYFFFILAFVGLNTLVAPGYPYFSKTIRIYIDSENLTLKEFLIRKKLLPLYTEADLTLSLHQARYNSTFVWNSMLSRNINQQRKNNRIQLVQISVNRIYAIQLYDEIQQMLGFSLDLKQRSSYLKKLYKGVEDIYLDEMEDQERNRNELLSKKDISLLFSGVQLKILSFGLFMIILLVPTIILPLVADAPIDPEFIVFDRTLTDYFDSIQLQGESFTKIQIWVGEQDNIRDKRFDFRASVIVNGEFIVETDRRNITRFDISEEQWIEESTKMHITIHSIFPVHVRVASGHQNSYSFTIMAFILVVSNLLMIGFAVDQKPVNDLMLKRFVNAEFPLRQEKEQEKGISWILILIILIAYPLLFHAGLQLFLLEGWWVAEILIFLHLQMQFGWELLIYVLYSFGYLLLNSLLAGRKGSMSLFTYMLPSLTIFILSFGYFPVIYSFFI
ncbi:MAG: hypothetical protein INQ03_22360 [Candidatus Heimdallarchaeota archaeon]|nr:hypothetical protein [Candidatus Heimdallarchaeota archaeon]